MGATCLTRAAVALPLLVSFLFRLRVLDSCGKISDSDVDG